MTEIREGMNVLSADGERLGRIIRIEGDSLLIEKGLFFHKDYACSVNNIREVRGDDVILSLSKIQLETAIGGATEQTTDDARPSMGVRQDVRVPLKEEVRVSKEAHTEHRDEDETIRREKAKIERDTSPPASYAGDPDLDRNR